MEEVNKTTYDSNKVEAFRSAYTDYTSALDAYKTELTKFDGIMTQVRIDHNSRSHNGSSNDYTDSNYVETADNVIMKKTDPNGVYDLFSNSLDNNNYVSDKTYYNYKNLSNQFVQYNPHEELLYESSNYKETLKKLDDNDIVDISQSLACDDSFLRQCDAYAKMSNKPYYGLRQTPLSQTVSSNKCECYTFTEERLAYTDDIQEASANASFDEDTSFSYLGVLFDGNVYTLKDVNYSNNFDNLFVKNDNNVTSIINNDNTSGLNPFTGKGVYGIELGNNLQTEFGFKNCSTT